MDESETSDQAADQTSDQSADRPRTRIQRRNTEAIMEAALDVFSQHGFRGATLDQIAEVAGLSKPNLLYYFASKEAGYVTGQTIIVDGGQILPESLEALNQA